MPKLKKRTTSRDVRAAIPPEEGRQAKPESHLIASPPPPVLETRLPTAARRTVDFHESDFSAGILEDNRPRGTEPHVELRPAPNFATTDIPPFRAVSSLTRRLPVKSDADSVSIEEERSGATDAAVGREGDRPKRRRGRRGGRGRNRPGARPETDDGKTMTDAVTAETASEDVELEPVKAAGKSETERPARARRGRRGRSRGGRELPSKTAGDPKETSKASAAETEADADEVVAAIPDEKKKGESDAVPAPARRAKKAGSRSRGRARKPASQTERKSPDKADARDDGEPVQANDTATEEADVADEEQDRPSDQPRSRRRRYNSDEIEDAPEMVESIDVDEDADVDDDDESQPLGNRKMLINVADPDECRIALIQDGRLDELYIERATSTSNVGNIYKGRVTNVEASIQAAFVDFGLPSHGFLHISDLHPQYFPNGKGDTEQVGRKTPRRSRPPIQQCLSRGSEVIVQIIKEGIGTKGPTLTTYISLPGRFLVMMPGMDQLGVSRKIEDEEQRRKARQQLSQLSLPTEMGFIVRTAGIDRGKRDLQRDLNYLLRLWKRVEARMERVGAPAALYKESDLVIRTIRDVYDANIGEIVVDNPLVATKVREFLAVASPRSKDIVAAYDGSEPMFYKYGVESEIDKLHSRHVPLPCGGSLVIESTEALVAIDVNSGRFRVPDNAEETAYRVNLEAVDEIARQLRLRDLGGLIICDMIDMNHDRHRRTVENRLRDALKSHKERAKLLRMSKFGIIEMTRQRQRPSLAKSVFRECPRCSGIGRVKATESIALDVMRQIRLAVHRDSVARVDVRVPVDVANDLLNRKRVQLAELEKNGNQRIRIEGRPDYGADQISISLIDRRGRELTPLSGVSVGSPAAPPGVGRPQGNGNRTMGRNASHGGHRRGPS